MNQSSQHQQSFGRRLKRTLIIVAVTTVVIMLIVAGFGVYWYLHTNRAPITARPIIAQDGNTKTTANEDVIANIAERLSPSVVSIVTNTTTQTIFGAAQSEAAGTGIVVSKDGYIMTNKHVVSGATNIQVILADGTRYSEVVTVGADPLNDIAFLKIDNVNNLQPVTLGDSSTVRVGQEVVAIGNSLGQYQNTVTSGIVSGKGRPVAAGNESGQMVESLTDLLQTDAAINPGNSGGPLLNRSGQVIGINTAVAANAQGIGFAIPINATKGMLKSVISGKGVKRAYLGVRYVALTAAVAKQYSLPTSEGAYLVAGDGGSAIQPDGPASKAGLKDKDIIIKINDMTVGKQGGVSSLIGEYAPGDTVAVTVLRDSKQLSIKVTLAGYSN
ncbi:MAG: trypsin-like peptidase domain-containing protein [Candidatus Saccharimonas sp.]